MSLERLFDALATILWPILDLLLVLLGVLTVLLIGAAIVAWVVLKSPDPRPVLSGKAFRSRTKKAKPSPDLGNHSS